jgi:hypothetical protein
MSQENVEAVSLRRWMPGAAGTPPVAAGQTTVGLFFGRDPVADTCGHIPPVFGHMADTWRTHASVRS